MKEVAKLLELELGEEFKLKDNTNGGYFNTHFALTENGLENIGDKIIYRNLLECILKGRYDIVKIPKAVLTDKEREYLSQVIRPWKEEVASIVKFEDSFDDEEEKECIVIKTDSDAVILPFFKKGTMYKRMEVGKEYSLEDLGL